MSDDDAYRRARKLRWYKKEGRRVGDLEAQRSNPDQEDLSLLSSVIT